MSRAKTVNANYGRFEPSGQGPTQAVDFEKWRPDEDNPVELIGGWVLPMAPGNLETGSAWGNLYAVLLPLIRAKRWTMALDARHRLPAPPQTVVYPDLVIHRVDEVGYLPRTHSVGRVPDLAVEFLSDETHERDVARNGAKFLAYQMSGVREYYYSWPDGTDASGFVLRRGVFAPLPRDGHGFFRSPLLGCAVRLVEAAIKPIA